MNTFDYISFVEKRRINPSHKFKINFYFFFFNIFWLARHKMFSFIPIWFFFMLSCFSIFNTLTSFSFFKPLPMQGIAAFISLVPYILLSGFIYYIQFIWKSNIIWKHANSPFKQAFWITPLPLVPTILLSLALIMLLFNLTARDFYTKNLENNPYSFQEIQEYQRSLIYLQDISEAGKKYQEEKKNSQ